jgi:hypothetical protein
MHSPGAASFLSDELWSISPGILAPHPFTSIHHVATN